MSLLKMAITDQVEQLVESAIETLGYELVGVEYIQGGPSPVLRIYIDAKNGIVIEDCERASHQISGILDVEDPVKSAYVLEVSSPGFDRPLFKAKDFERFAGEKAKITMKLPVHGRRNFTGILQGLSGDDILIEVDGEICALSLNRLAKARLIA